ncbi:polysaccharide export protein [Nitrosomonas sp. Nm166]|uniref:polysaccharide export protein n=1 Tax=Nitrosomonas sp. Nm166 TaxID=1881054 RepID=UPI0008ED83B8|nr:polysaccharide export protein [Nitrosomonas sp. Nm166]SFD91330.1 polysaccharide export outer membrane protein [Nitrosomonas sp. Nm166]
MVINNVLFIQEIKFISANIFLILMILSQLTGCTVIPGQHMRAFSTQSSVEMPTQEDNETILKRLNIQTINAQLIVNMEKDINNRSLGPDNVANHYFDYRIGSKTIKGTPEKEPYDQYRVGPRDILNITVWGHPELTIPAGEFRSAETAGNVVGEDGTFFYPYAGVIQAAGRTVEEIRAELTRKLSKYIENVQLDVRVAGYRSQRVYVVGEVAQPGIHLVKDIPLTVLEAINSAGGVKPEADLRNITLTRDNKTYSINLLSLYEGGDIKQNVLLRHGDVLNVPDNVLNKVFVLGETTLGRGFGVRPRSVIMNKARMTLTEALAEGGGFDQETSDAARIFVFRSALGRSAIFHLDAKSPDALILADRFPLQPRDVVFVDRAEGIRWNQIIAQIQPTVDLLNLFDGSLRVQPFRTLP